MAVKTKENPVITEYLEAYNKYVFPNSVRMQEYRKKTLSNVFKTSFGAFIPMDKPTLETRFCFSFDEHVSGSIEDSNNTLRNFQDEAFKKENLKELTEKIVRLQDPNNKIYFMSNYRVANSIGSFVTQDYILRFPNDDKKYTELSDSDRSGLINMYNEELKKFEKRLDTYLKKYGTSKLTKWTYSCWD